MKNKKGFTLIELLVIVVIIGVLAAIAIPQFARYRTKSFNATAMSDLRNAMTAQEAYHTDWDTYTDDENVLESDYSLHESDDVEFSIDPVITGKDAYHMEAYHTKGNLTYQIDGPGGSVEVKL